MTPYAAQSGSAVDAIASWRPQPAVRRRWFRGTDRLEDLSFVAEHVVGNGADGDRFRRGGGPHRQGPADYLVATSGDRCGVNHVFDGLRWGGQFIFVSPRAREAEQVLRRYQGCSDFLVETDLQVICRPRRRWRGLRLEKKFYVFAARKTSLVRTGDATDRYTYDVCLVPEQGAARKYVVLKQVPSFEDAVQRLTQSCQEATSRQIETGARKLVNKVFPLFLTRETAFLKILQRDLPEQCKARFPTVQQYESDDHGMVRQVTLNWLRLGGEPISQLDFARQSAALLHIVHEHVGLIHMDLRLDNFVVTERGVGFVDFGSAVRVGECFDRNPLLDTLFHEMLSTSQIQKDLKRYRDERRLTSRLFANCCGKIDKAADLFYLVLQMNHPHANPDFRGLIRYDRQSAEAHQLARLTRSVLRPKDPQRPPCRSARDVADRITDIERTLGK